MKNKDKNKNKRYRISMSTPASVVVRETEGSEPSRTITGYAVLFNNLSEPLWKDEDSEAREQIAPEAMTQEFLDECDIKMTMFHDREKLLARSRNGQGSLRYTVDGKGVRFEFEAPNTADGDAAIEAVRRGDINSCSFIGTTKYGDDAFVSRESMVKDGRSLTVFTIRAFIDVIDFTLAADPYYPDTTAELAERERLRDDFHPVGKDDVDVEREAKIKEQIEIMRRTAAMKIY